MKQAVRISAKNEGVRTWTAVERVGKYFEWSISEKNMEKKKKALNVPMKITNLSGFGLSTFSPGTCGPGVLAVKIMVRSHKS